jgi:protein-disulfide isomerase
MIPELGRALAGLFVLSAATAVAQVHLVEGKADSPVRVVIYEDLQCPDCADFRVMLDQKLLPRYGAKVAFEHRDFPLPKHKWARPAAVAARFFQQQSAALAILWRRETMRDQAGITAETFPAYFVAFAKRNAIDPAQAEAALNDPALAALVQKDYEDGVARGIAHTPTALVNGAPFIETFTFEAISAGIDSALKESGIQ